MLSFLLFNHAAAGYALCGNVTVANNKGQFDYMNTFSVPLVNSILYGRTSASGSGTASGNATDGSASGSAQFSGNIGFASCTLAPRVWTAAFAGTANLNADIVNAVAGGTASISGSAAFCGFGYISITEYDSNNNPVAATLGLGLNGYRSTAINGVSVTTGPVTNGVLHQYTCNCNTVIQPYGATITIDALYTEATGKLCGGAPITPGSMKTTLNISNWQYKTAGNHLALRLVTALAAVTVDTTLNQRTVTPQMTAGSGQGQCYFQTANTATTNAGVVPVNIMTSNLATADISADGTGFDAAVVAKVNPSYKYIDVHFPADATSISYDPTTGAGPAPVYGSASLAKPISVLAVIIAAFALFF